MESNEISNKKKYVIYMIIGIYCICLLLATVIVLMSILDAIYTPPENQYKAEDLVIGSKITYTLLTSFFFLFSTVYIFVRWLFSQLLEKQKLFAISKYTNHPNSYLTWICGLLFADHLEQNVKMVLVSINTILLLLFIYILSQGSSFIYLYCVTFSLAFLSAFIVVLPGTAAKIGNL